MTAAQSGDPRLNGECSDVAAGGRVLSNLHHGGVSMQGVRETEASGVSAFACEECAQWSQSLTICGPTVWPPGKGA